jgi:hypothetical protein
MTIKEDIWFSWNSAVGIGIGLAGLGIFLLGKPSFVYSDTFMKNRS